MTGAITKVQAKRKTKVGRVVSDRMDKTIVVSVERLARHRLYKRVIRLTTKFKAHDETNDARIGDTVLIEESRPISATKRWRLVSVVQRAGEHGLADLQVIVAGAPRWLAPGGALVVELDPRQVGAVQAAARSAGFVETTVRRDLAGRERVLVARLGRPSAA